MEEKDTNDPSSVAVADQKPGSGSMTWLGRLLNEEGTDLMDEGLSSLRRGTPVYVHADAALLAVQRVMAQNHIRLLPVLEGGRVVGMLDLVALAEREDLSPDDTVGDAATF